MRALGVDYGTSRTGIAVGDSETGLSFPFAVFEEKDMDELVKRILEVASGEGCETIVVGCPVRLTGHKEMGETEKLVHELVSRLRSAEKMEVVIEDERMSTAYAEKMKREAGSAAKMGADAIAAAAILETYLERVR
jgi:putative Holliday junction resolvase